jgi:hypothetical protein
MMDTRTAIAQVIGGPHDGSRIDDISPVELRAAQVQRWDDVYVLSLVYVKSAGLKPKPHALHAYHPSAVKLIGN